MADPDVEFRRLLRANGTLHEILSNGNSFYACLAEFLQDGMDYVAVKEVVHDHMKDNIETFGNSLQGGTREEKLAYLKHVFRDGAEPLDDHIYLSSLLFDLRIVLFYAPNGRAVVNEAENFRGTVFLSCHHNPHHFNLLTDTPDLPRDAGHLPEGALDVGLGNPQKQDDDADSDARFMTLLSANGRVQENPKNGNSFYTALAEFIGGGLDYSDVKEVVNAHIKDNLEDVGIATLESLGELFRDGVEPQDQHIKLASLLFELRIVVFSPPNARVFYNESENFNDTLYLSCHANRHFNRLFDFPDLPRSAGDLTERALDLPEFENLDNPPEQDDDVDSDARFMRLLCFNAKVHENPKDGNSFYKSLAQFIGSCVDYRSVKEVIHSYMRDKLDLFGHSLEGDTTNAKLETLAKVFRDGAEPVDNQINMASKLFGLRIVVFYAPNCRVIYDKTNNFTYTLYLSWHATDDHFNRLLNYPDLSRTAQDSKDGALTVPKQQSIVSPPFHPPKPKEKFGRILYNHCKVFHNPRNANSFYDSLAAFLPGDLNPVAIRDLCVDYVRNNTDQFEYLFQEGDSQAEKKAIVNQMSDEGRDAIECHVAAAAALFNIRIVVYHARNSRTIDKVEGFEDTLYLARDEDYHYDRIVRGPELPIDADDLDDNAFDANGLYADP